MIMKKHTLIPRDEMEAMAEDARALIAATADIAGEKITEARKRLTAAIERGKDKYQELYDDVREKAVDGTKAADVAVRENPYQAVAIGVGVGAMVGLLLASRCFCKRD